MPYHAGYILTQWITDAGRLLYKYMYLSLYCKGSKRVTQCLPVRGSWKPKRNCNILTPTVMAVNVVSVSFSRCSTGGPAAGWWLSLLHLISIFSGPQTPSRFPRAPLAGCGFPYDISSITPSPILTGTGTVLTELYNSSTPTRSPTRSLEWHDWSSSSGNNCHAVHRSLSSGASVYESIMGFFSLSHFVSQFPPTRFPLLTVIGMCHFLPVHHLEWHFGPDRRSKYNNMSSYKSGLFKVFT